MSILLDFVYTSTTPTLDGCTDMELVCNVLVTADQLLLPRLKEMTETVLVDMSKFAVKFLQDITVTVQSQCGLVFIDDTA